MVSYQNPTLYLVRYSYGILHQVNTKIGQEGMGGPAYGLCCLCDSLIFRILTAFELGNLPAFIMKTLSEHMLRPL